MSDNEEIEHPVRAAVVGYGAYGRLHARKYFEHPAVELTAVVDTDTARLRDATTAFPGVLILNDPRLLAGHADIASVVVPATHHFHVGCQLLDVGLHLLVEKPLTTSPQDARRLCVLAESRGCVLQPGHLERFNGTLAALRRLAISPRYVEARRLTQWRGRGDDVSVVFDLMIHDIDLLLEIVPAPITQIHAHGVKIFSPHWDVASARLQFADSCVASLTASRANPIPERRVHVFAEDACLLVDIDAGMLLRHRRAGQEAQVVTERRFYDSEDPLAAEVASFVDAVRRHRQPIVTATDGRRAVEIAARISEAMEQDAHVLAEIAAPLTDSRQAIAYLQRGHA